MVLEPGFAVRRSQHSLTGLVLCFASLCLGGPGPEAAIIRGRIKRAVGSSPRAFVYLPLLLLSLYQFVLECVLGINNEDNWRKPQDWRDSVMRCELSRSQRPFPSGRSSAQQGSFRWTVRVLTVHDPTSGAYCRGRQPGVGRFVRCSHPTNNVVHPLTCWTEGTSTTRGSRRGWVIGP